MAETVKQNVFLSGSNGTVWFAGEPLAELASLEAKVTGNFEDVDCCGDYATYSQYNGYKIAGTLKLHKVNSRVMAKYAAAYLSGVMPDVSITTKLADPNTGAAERTSITGVVVTEFAAANFEAKKLVDEEMPFSAVRMNVLEAI